MALCPNQISATAETSPDRAALVQGNKELIMRLTTTTNTRLDSTGLGADRHSSLLDKVIGYFSAMRERAQTRAAIEGLLAYDDRMLDDMGLTRQDVYNALSSSGTENPSERLARIKRARRLADPMRI